MEVLVYDSFREATDIQENKVKSKMY